MVGHTRKINQIVYGKRNEMWTCSDDGSVRVWDTESYQCKHVLNIKAGAARCMAVDDNGVWVGFLGNCVVRYSIHTYIPLQEVGTTSSVQCLRYVIGQLWIGLAGHQMLIYTLPSHPSEDTSSSI